MNKHLGLISFYFVNFQHKIKAKYYNKDERKDENEKIKKEN